MIYQYEGSASPSNGDYRCRGEGRGGRATIGLVNGDKADPYWKVLVSPKGLFQGDGGLAEENFPYPLLKLPANPGEKWEVAGKPRAPSSASKRWRSRRASTRRPGWSRKD